MPNSIFIVKLPSAHRACALACSMNDVISANSCPISEIFHVVFFSHFPDRVEVISPRRICDEKMVTFEDFGFVLVALGVISTCFGISLLIGCAC